MSNHGDMVRAQPADMPVYPDPDGIGSSDDTSVPPVSYEIRCSFWPIILFIAGYIKQNVWDIWVGMVRAIWVCD